MCEYNVNSWTTVVVIDNCPLTYINLQDVHDKVKYTKKNYLQSVHVKVKCTKKNYLQFVHDKVKYTKKNYLQSVHDKVKCTKKFSGSFES